MMTVKPKKKKKRSVKGLEERKKPQTRAYTYLSYESLFNIKVFKEKDGVIEDMPRITLCYLLVGLGKKLK